jgi:hypothetical protein
MAVSLRSQMQSSGADMRLRIMDFLRGHDGVADPSGRASSILRTEVAYPGSSIEFSRFLAGMERDGLITREVRGRRTFLIAPSAESPAASVVPSGRLDYDRLARALLDEVVRRSQGAEDPLRFDLVEARRVEDENAALREELAAATATIRSLQLQLEDVSARPASRVQLAPAERAFLQELLSESVVQTKAEEAS